MEVPGRSGLAGRTADAVARGLGRAQTSSRQPLSGLRPLGLRMEVGPSFFFCGSEVIRSVDLLLIRKFSLIRYLLYFVFHSVHYIFDPKFHSEHKIKCFIVFVGSGV